MREFILIEAPSNLGLAPLTPGTEPGTKYFSAELLKTGFADKAGITERSGLVPPDFSEAIDEETKVRNADAIVAYSERLATVVANAVHADKKPIVIGGDCSILIGAALGLRRVGHFSLVSIDGHTDYVLPHQSGSNGAAGMALAIVTGNGHNKLTNIEGLKPYIQEEDVHSLGNRDISDSWYVQAIEQSNIHYADLYSIRSKSIDAILELFWKNIRRRRTDGFWIHLDVDVLDDHIMPCVDSRQEGGMSYDELAMLLVPLLSSPYFTGMDITIFDPTLDREGKYIRQFSDKLAEILNSKTD